MSKEWAKRAALPSHVVTMLDNFPTNLHPMSQFSAAITALNSESSFARAYSEGVHKSKYWEVSLHPYLFFFEKYGLIEFFFFFFLLKRLNHFRHKNAFSLVSCGLFLCNLSFFFFFLKFIYEDSMDLIAKLPCIAAKIYRNLYREGSSIGAIDSNLDWSHNFTNMLGYSDPQFTELMRLYLTIHRCNLRCLFT